MARGPLSRFLVCQVTVTTFDGTDSARGVGDGPSRLSSHADGDRVGLLRQGARAPDQCHNKRNNTLFISTSLFRQHNAGGGQKSGPF